ncbi:hypothetical protein EVAR_23469_1 [Eumeta japonica]|uniref:Uncharacterized protein n=1 Tax=Eumeta variegata TaxID=151549 RepID=A0A4C1UJU4_EUMVA|nr:hypothetical protein EVAR_23469_1 [Eumeta japonica]
MEPPCRPCRKLRATSEVKAFKIVISFRHETITSPRTADESSGVRPGAHIAPPPYTVRLRYEVIAEGLSCGYDLDVPPTGPRCFFGQLFRRKQADGHTDGKTGCGWESLMKSVTLGNVTMSHRTRERPAECLASLSHSTMIGLPRAQH